MDSQPYQSKNWKIEYPVNWNIEHFKNGVTFFDDEDEVGALQISGYLKDKKVTLKDIDELLEDETPENTELNYEKIGTFEGYSTEYNYEDHFWRIWFLTKDKLLLYITYNCELEYCEIERETVDQIINSLE